LATVTGIIILVGLIFCPVAGAMAYLVTYEEYQHHGLGQRQIVMHALQAAVEAALFFALAAVVIGVLAPGLFGKFG
jgi:uncharacterized membrane-anchored protein